jgi:hypothetical protein
MNIEQPAAQPVRRSCDSSEGSPLLSSQWPAIGAAGAWWVAAALAEAIPNGINASDATMSSLRSAANMLAK